MPKSPGDRVPSVGNAYYGKERVTLTRPRTMHILSLASSSHLGLFPLAPASTALPQGPLAIGGLGWQELIIVLLIVLVLFGAHKLPGLARAMGASITQFKKGLGDEEADGTRLSEGDESKQAE